MGFFACSAVAGGGSPDRGGGHGSGGGGGPIRGHQVPCRPVQVTLLQLGTSHVVPPWQHAPSALGGGQTPHAAGHVPAAAAAADGAAAAVSTALSTTVSVTGSLRRAIAGSSQEPATVGVRVLLTSRSNLVSEDFRI